MKVFANVVLFHLGFDTVKQIIFRSLQIEIIFTEQEEQKNAKAKYAFNRYLI